MIPLPPPGVASGQDYFNVIKDCIWDQMNKMGITQAVQTVTKQLYIQKIVFLKTFQDRFNIVFDINWDKDFK